MIVVAVASRRIPSSTRNKLCSYGLVVKSYSAVMQSSQSMSSDSSSVTGNSKPPSLLASEVFSNENKARTIALLNNDRENFYFDFAHYGKSCRKAAVLVPLCVDLEGRPGVLMNLRSETLHTHSGEISFPGGTFEPEDLNDPINAALRETSEEIGLSSDEVEIWTTLRVFPTVSTKLGVYPVLGFIKSSPLDLDNLTINPDEVDHAFIIPLEHLCQKKNWAEMLPPTKVAGRTFRVPTYKNLHEISPGLRDISLWGLTAFISHLVLTALLPDHYHREIPYIKLSKVGPPVQQIKKNTADSSGDGDKTKPSSKL